MNACQRSRTRKTCRTSLPSWRNYCGGVAPYRLDFQNKLRRMTSIRDFLFQLVPTSLKMSGRCRLSGRNSGSHIDPGWCVTTRSYITNPRPTIRRGSWKMGGLTALLGIPKIGCSGRAEGMCLPPWPGDDCSPTQHPRLQDLSGQMFRSLPAHFPRLTSCRQSMRSLG